MASSSIFTKKKFFSKVPVFNASTPRTSPAPNYVPPRKEDIVRASEKQNLRTFDSTMIEDMVNLASGGKFENIDRITQAVDEEVESIYKNSRTNNYYTVTGDKGVASSVEEAKQIYKETRLQYHTGVREFLSSLDVKGIPGASPLEKGINLAKILQNQKHSQEKSDGGAGNSFDPSFSSKQTAREMAQKINSAIGASKGMSEKEMEIFDFVDIDAIEQISRSLDKYPLFEMARQLRVHSLITTQAQVDHIVDPEGDDVQSRALEGLHEIGRMPTSNFAKPPAYMSYKILSGDVYLQEKTTKKSKKQFLFMIGDNSGSMGGDNRYLKLGGVLLNRMEAVLNGDAVLDFAFFHSSLCNTIEVKTLQDCQNLIAQIEPSNFDKGSTDIPRCAIAAYKRIQERLVSGEYGTTPELIIATDGQDDCSGMLPRDFIGVRVHTFVLGGYSEDLRRLSVQTGGMSIQSL